MMCKCNDMQCTCIPPKLKSNIILNVKIICKIKENVQRLIGSILFIKHGKFLDIKQIKETYDYSIGLRHVRYYNKGPILIVLALKGL